MQANFSIHISQASLLTQMIAELFPQLLVLYFFLTNIITIFIWLKLMLIDIFNDIHFAGDIFGMEQAYIKKGHQHTY